MGYQYFTLIIVQDGSHVRKFRVHAVASSRRTVTKLEKARNGD